MSTTVLWFRRDLRLADHPALVEAVSAGRPVVALFVSDPTLRGPSGAPRLAFLSRCLRALDESTGGYLVVRSGAPLEIVPAVAAEVGAGTVHISADFGPYGHTRDEAVARVLAASGRRLVRAGSPYAVEPGDDSEGRRRAVPGLQPLLPGVDGSEPTGPSRRSGRRAVGGLRALRACTARPPDRRRAAAGG